MGSKAINFQSLLESSLQLTSHVDQHGMPPIERSFDQIEVMSRKLASKSARGGESAKNKAHYLLAGKGFDADKLSRTLHAIDLKTSFEPLEALSETDIHGYLRHQHEMIILTAIEEAKSETISQFNAAFVRSMEADWDKSKRELLEALGQRSGPWRDTWSYDQSSIMGSNSDNNNNNHHNHHNHNSSFDHNNNSTPGGPMSLSSDSSAPTPRRVRSGLDAAMSEYARLVAALNDARLTDTPFGVLSVGVDVAAGVHSPAPSSDHRRAEVIDAWRLLAAMLGERDVVKGEFQRDILRPQHFAEAYMVSEPDLSAALVKGALDFLQTQYREVMEARVAQEARTARRGPLPGTVSLVKAFLNVAYERPKDWPAELAASPQVDGYPAWVLLYYALRLGDTEAAKELVDAAGDALGNFGTYFAEWVSSSDGSLPSHISEAMGQEWRRTVRNARDPFHQAVWNLIGRCDVHKPLTGVFTTTQDFLWAKLAMISPGFTIADLQELLNSYGAAHFSPDGRAPLLFFQVLLMSQQFEAAVEFLSAQDHYNVEAVHFAIALHYYGLLRTWNPPPEAAGHANGDRMAASEPPDLLIDGALNYGRLIRGYVRPFLRSDPRVAVEYVATVVNRRLRNSYLKDLVLDTREFDMLLGGLLPDGTRYPGLLERYVEDPDLKGIIDVSAVEAESQGLYDIAVTLYDRAGDYDKVLTILSSQLSQVLTVPTSGLRAPLIALAQSVYSLYRSRNLFHSVKDARNVTTFELMLQLIQVFDLYHAGRLEDALSLMESLNIIPLDSTAIDARVAAFRSLDDVVKRNFAEILLTTMTILYKLYGAAKGKTGGAAAAGGREAVLGRLRSKGRALITFSGMIQFRMPGDINAQLIRMDVFMA